MDNNIWFKKNTFHHRNYSDLKKLVEQKNRKGLSISLCLPTKNEIKTLEPIIKVISEDTMQRYPLVDELIIMDSHSTDNIKEVAEKYGIPLYNDDEVLTEAGSYPGKGEALWKSLYLMNSDLIGWIDADIKNFDSHFVYGLLGPLIENPNIGFIKAFYQRPIKEGGVLRESGGGRVTEITARPIINLFYPELAGFIQPLSGEYAGRREIFTNIPFFTGYAVELGMLIHIFHQFGLFKMAQVDLAKRIHRNQSTKALGRMSFAILQAVFKFLEEDRHIELQTQLNQTLQSISYKKGTYQLMPHEINVIERPPIAKYLQDHKPELTNG